MPPRGGGGGGPGGLGGKIPLDGGSGLVARSREVFLRGSNAKGTVQYLLPARAIVAGGWWSRMEPLLSAQRLMGVALRERGLWVRCLGQKG